MRSKLIFGLLAFGLIATGLWGQEKPKEEKPPESTAAPAQGAQAPHDLNVSAADAARKNAVKFDEASVNRGKKVYNTQCSMCHGKDGDGKGEMVEEMKINPPDFTKPDKLKSRTDGEWFAIIGTGSSTMPGQGTRMADKQKWDLVNYLRSLGGQKPAKAAGKEPEENVILVPQ